MKRAIRVLGSAAAAAMLLASTAAAQGSCQFNGFATCTVGGDATHSISVTITATSRVQLAGGTAAIPTPDNAAYAAGISGQGSVTYQVKANNPWSISISGAAAVWTATPGSARQNKPVSDLQWATAPAGPFADLSTTQVTLSTGTATAGVFRTVYFRSKLAYANDNPGSYSLLVNLTITAP